MIYNIGKHQSPIDIKTHFSVYDQHLISNPMLIDYDDLSCCHIKNSGGTFQVTSSVDSSGMLTVKLKQNFM
jgi:carbonic anhydrase